MIVYNEKIKKISQILLLGIIILVVGTFIDKSEEYEHQFCHHDNCVACSIIKGNSLFLKNISNGSEAKESNNLLLNISIVMLIFVFIYDSRIKTLIDMKARMDC